MIALQILFVLTEILKNKLYTEIGVLPSGVIYLTVAGNTDGKAKPN